VIHTNFLDQTSFDVHMHVFLLVTKSPLFINLFLNCGGKHGFFGTKNSLNPQNLRTRFGTSKEQAKLPQLRLGE
jgi:hypothetical protein